MYAPSPLFNLSLHVLHDVVVRFWKFKIFSWGYEWFWNQLACFYCSISINNDVNGRFASNATGHKSKYLTTNCDQQLSTSSWLSVWTIMWQQLQWFPINSHQFSGQYISLHTHERSWDWVTKPVLFWQFILQASHNVIKAIFLHSSWVKRCIFRH